MSQPLFYVLLAIGVFGLILFPFVPYNTLGEDIKMVKDEGLTLIMVLSIMLALWTASVSIADEIEGRTALTLLSKPVGRRQFILGKFLGILVPVAIMFLVLGAMFLASVSYKVVYDARETGPAEPTLADCQTEMLQIAPGLLLSFMEAVVLTAISVAISTRLPMLANLMICAAIYVLGHLVPVWPNPPWGRIEFVRFVANLHGRDLARARPLQHFRRHFDRAGGAAAVPGLGRAVLPGLQHRGHAGGAVAVRGPGSGVVALSRLDPHPAAFDHDAAGDDQPQRLGIGLAFGLEHAGGQRFRRVVVEHRNGLLQNHRAVVVLVVGEVDRAAAQLRPVVQHGLVDAVTVKSVAAKRRHQGRMDVHDAVRRNLPGS